MSKQSEPERQSVVRHHQIVKETTEMLHELGYQPIREVAKADMDTKHEDVFTFWAGGAVLLVVHRRTPLPGAVSPVPLFEVYCPLCPDDNTMTGLREALEEIR